MAPVRGRPGRVTCLACGARPRAFVRYGEARRPGLCPRCGAKPRHRALLIFLRRFVRRGLDAGSEVLDIGPSRAVTGFVPSRRAIGAARYTAVDLERRTHPRRLQTPHRLRCMEDRRLRFPTMTFHVILCNNVLPSTEHDRAMLAEIRRCLKPEGVAMVDVVVQVARTTATRTLQRRDPGQFTPSYVRNHGSHRFYGR